MQHKDIDDMMKIFPGRLLVWMSLIALVCLSMGSCQRKGEWRTVSGAVWNTTYNIKYYGPENLADSVMEVIGRVGRSLSPFNKSSLVSQINRMEAKQTDTLFRRMFALSLRVNEASGGLFDPTVSPVVNLWKFGYTGKVDADSVWEPSQAQIDSAMTAVGIRRCSITSEGVLRRATPPATFNFSAVAKGYACDLVLEMLRRNGVDNAMVEIGGEIACCGRNPRGEMWHIQVDKPEFEPGAPRHNAYKILEITDCGVATSGNYRNYHRDSHGRVGHTISPLTGRPVVNDILSVTVVAPTCAEADAWATAAMASHSADEAEAMLRRAGLRYEIVRE